MTLTAVIVAAALAAFSSNGMDDPHSGLRNVSCIECHERLPFAAGAPPRLREEVGTLCGTCHKQHHGANALKSHPVNRVPTMPVPPDMILDRQGRIVCVTCHAFHGAYLNQDGSKQFYLRRSPGKTFCFSCHRSRP